MRYMTGAVAVAAAAMVWAAPAAAQQKFAGNWKIDEASARLPAKPTVWAMEGNSFSCKSCTYPYTVPADGAFHAVSGNPYVDEIAVTVVDASTVKMRTQKAGKLLGENTRVVQPDKMSLVSSGVDNSSPNGTPIRYRDTMKRVGPAGTGHLIAGSWRAESNSTQDAAGLMFTLAVAGKKVTYTTPTGEKLEGTIGGPATPWYGDQGGALGAITMPAADTLRFTTTLKGKPIGMVDLKLAPDGRMIDATAKNLQQGTTTQLKAMKS